MEAKGDVSVQIESLLNSSSFLNRTYEYDVRELYRQLAVTLCATPRTVAPGSKKAFDYIYEIIKIVETVDRARGPASDTMITSVRNDADLKSALVALCDRLRPPSDLSILKKENREDPASFLTFVAAVSDVLLARRDENRIRNILFAAYIIQGTTQSVSSGDKFFRARLNACGLDPKLVEHVMTIVAAFAHPLRTHDGGRSWATALLHSEWQEGENDALEAQAVREAIIARNSGADHPAAEDPIYDHPPGPVATDVPKISWLNQFAQERYAKIPDNDSTTALEIYLRSAVPEVAKLVPIANDKIDHKKLEETRPREISAANWQQVVSLVNETVDKRVLLPTAIAGASNLANVLTFMVPKWDVVMAQMGGKIGTAETLRQGAVYKFFTDPASAAEAAAFAKAIFDEVAKIPKEAVDRKTIAA